MIIQAIIAGFVLASAIVFGCLAVAALIAWAIDRQEPFKAEYARRKGGFQ